MTKESQQRNPPLTKGLLLRKSRTIWLTKTVDITARLQLPVVTYTSPGLRRPHALL